MEMPIANILNGERLDTLTPKDQEQGKEFHSHVYSTLRRRFQAVWAGKTKGIQIGKEKGKTVFVYRHNHM